ncbi:EAL domain-containing protein [Iodobacter sp. HSC-16F04]|uniref:EAL domain-containing protein n=1 Tax=Iodobacter violaceini TaxID=3044271 RepID=A0ABX0KVQ7_9NEIS|nr:EAL domain-containing protein [Iodobacter violacea]NHQ87921.1 EAL domain-containing protein [Iodobacter violacea]
MPPLVALKHRDGVINVPQGTLNDWPMAQFASTKDRGIVVKALGLELTSAFLAVFDAHTRQIIGEEALLRASIRRKALSAADVFKSAQGGDCLVEFDRLCRSLHLMNHLAGSNTQRTLFLNVYPELLMSSGTPHIEAFERILQDQGLSPADIVLEVFESTIPPGQTTQLAHAIKNYRARGYKIAIDDYGFLNSNLNRLLTLSPEIVKLDRVVMDTVSKEAAPKAQQLLCQFVERLHGMGSQVVIEGINNAEQLALAQDSGADMLQGYFLSEPRYLNNENFVNVVTAQS